MQRPRLYLDEDVQLAVAAGLRRRGHDVLTTVEAGRGGSSDEEQLRFAISAKRCLFTFNRGHFAELHARVVASGEHHWGIIVSPQLHIGRTVRALAALLSRHPDTELHDKLVWLRG